MADSSIIGVILAAGRGSRIQPLNMTYPKPLLPVCNKAIMQYQLEDMRRIGVTEAIIVVGHLADHIVAAFGDGSGLGMKLRYVEQHEALGIAHAVAQLESEISSPFILFLGDIFMVPRNLEQMVGMYWQRRAGAVLAVKPESDPALIQRNFAVVLHASGTVTRVIEKPRYIPSNLKGCGIYMFDLAIFDAIRRTPRTAQRDEYEITNSIQILIDDGFPVYPAHVIDWDMNVTYPCDLLECNCRQLAHMGLESVVAPSAQLHPGVRVQRSVIGEHVRITRPIAVKDSLLFAGVAVDEAGDLDQALLAPSLRIQCEQSQERGQPCAAS